SWIDSFKKNKGTDTSTLKENLVFKQQQEKQKTLHMILMDTSASTLQNKTLGKSKGVIYAIANQAYINREEICIHEFGVSVFEKALNIIKSPKDIEPFLKTIKAGGGTPLVESLNQLKIWQKKLLKQSDNLTIFTYLLSDGRTNENLDSITPIENMVVIDLDSNYHSNNNPQNSLSLNNVIKRSKCENIAKRLNAQYICL
ncbi:MAG: hypothetical protein HRU38_15590, partial [Saccharospirillaceae bacterium]|nr:hypothetical protein [Pseudomonadales bacterium]NRB80064.1 hypothetical protein [Saccharospirillaceae bacterium]